MVKKLKTADVFVENTTLFFTTTKLSLLKVGSKHVRKQREVSRLKKVPLATMNLLTMTIIILIQIKY